MRLGIAWIFATCVLVVAAIACRESGPTSIEEYAEKLCDAELRALLYESRPRSKWGQFREELEEVIGILEDNIPPL